MYIQKQIVRGYNPYLTMGANDCATNMDVGLLVLEPGDDYVFDEPEKELAVDLLEGSVTFRWNDEARQASRPDTFRCPATCLHAPRRTRVVVEALEHESLPILCVQWHPERMRDKFWREGLANGDKLFGDFVERCQQG